MFKWLANKRNALYSPVQGKLINLSDVNDKVFASGMMGQGFAIVPSSGDVFSPCFGHIKTIAPTKHAIGIETDNGGEILLHFGIDTVDLKGKPFNPLVEIGDKIKPGKPIMSYNIEYVRDAEKDPTIMVIVIGFNNAIKVDEQTVEAQTEICKIED